VSSPRVLRLAANLCTAGGVLSGEHNLPPPPPPPPLLIIRARAYKNAPRRQPRQSSQPSRRLLRLRLPPRLLPPLALATVPSMAAPISLPSAALVACWPLVVVAAARSLPVSVAAIHQTISGVGAFPLRGNCRRCPGSYNTLSVAGRVGSGHPRRHSASPAAPCRGCRHRGGISAEYASMFCTVCKAPSSLYFSHD
jgi:hypothetical protein